MEAYTFFKLNKLRHNGNVENVDEIRKLLFCVTGEVSGENILLGIDFDSRALYYNVRLTQMGQGEPTKYLSQDQIDMIKEMILYYKVGSWEQFYEDPNSDEIMDGYGWMLTLEGKDMIVEKHRGSGAKKDDVIPSGFREFEKIIFGLAK